MKLIVGLGNPGMEYINTRHNVGFRTVDEFVHSENLSSFSDNKKLKSLISENPDLKIIKPNTFMNLSGEAIRLAANYYKIDNPENIIIVQDDLDIPLGEIKIQQRKSSAGHKGIISIEEYMDTNHFWRIRIGIAGQEKNMPGEKYVLSNFTAEEEELVKSIIKKSAIALKQCLANGMEKTAQSYNKKSLIDI